MVIIIKPKAIGIGLLLSIFMLVGVPSLVVRGINWRTSPEFVTEAGVPAEGAPPAKSGAAPAKGVQPKGIDTGAGGGSLSVAESGKQQNGTVKEAVATPLSGRRVVLDPGHGGYDPGALGFGLAEKNVCYDIAVRTAESLRADGVNAILTRSGDKFVDLGRRATIANEDDAEAFVSIHVNSSPIPWAGGTRTYTYTPDNLFSSEQRSAREHLAGAIQSRLINDLHMRDAGVDHANFEVLRETRMPAALVEVTFISNFGEARLLADSGFREKAAHSIAAGVEKFLEEKS